MTTVPRLGDARIRFKIPHARRAGREELRTYGIGAQILAELGITRLRVLSAPKIMHGITGFGLEVVEYVECN